MKAGGCYVYIDTELSNCLGPEMNMPGANLIWRSEGVNIVLKYNEFFVFVSSGFSGKGEDSAVLCASMRARVLIMRLPDVTFTGKNAWKFLELRVILATWFKQSINSEDLSCGALVID